MKQANRLLIIFLLVATVGAKAQLGIGTTNPATSAQLDVSSTTKGFLPPRMTGSQRDAIANPANGLVIYCIDCGGGQLNVFNYSSTSWTNMIGGAAATVTPLVIGQNYGGGKLAYILQPGDPGYDANVPHGLIAAASDQSVGAEWGCVNTDIPGAYGTALGTGNQNTIAIMAGCATAGIAARLCGDLVLNGYSDWYLPSKDEYYKLYLNRDVIGSFASVAHWSSSTNHPNSAWLQDFSNGSQYYYSKHYPFYARAVRAF